MDNEKFKNTIIDIKANKMYIMIDLDVVLEQDTINMRTDKQGNIKNDAVAIANTYQQDINEKYHLNIQLNTNTKANKEIFKAKKSKAKAKTTTKKAPAKKKTPKKATTKPKKALLINDAEELTDITEGLIRTQSGLLLDPNNKWDAIKLKKILARGE